MTNFAYIARGRLFVKLGADEPREIESPFALDVSARSSRIARKNAWKSGGTGARFMGGLGGMPDDALDAAAPPDPIRFAGVCRGRHAGELLYALTSGPVSGVFAFSEGEETRLFHTTDVHIESLACADDGSRIVCSVSAKAGAQHLAIMDGEGSELAFVTEGECIDGSPCFERGSADRVVYESRGLGTDAESGQPGIADAVVERLDVRTGEVRRVASVDDADCTLPRASEDGAIYFVERPKRKAFSPKPHHAVLDVLLFPFRLLGALVAYLNFFAMRWSGKPLLRSGTADAKRADAKRLWQARNVTSAIGGIDDDPALAEERGRATKDHALVRVHGASRTVVAQRVACFDVADDGTVVFSDGRDVFVVRAGGAPEKVVADEAITAIVAIPAQPDA